MPTRSPHPTPQKRHGVFFHSTAEGDGVLPAAAANTMPGNIVSAALMAAVAAMRVSTSRRVMVYPRAWGLGRIGIGQTGDQREALEARYPRERLVERVFGRLVRGVGDEYHHVPVEGGDDRAALERAQHPAQRVPPAFGRMDQVALDGHLRRSSHDELTLDGDHTSGSGGVRHWTKVLQERR